MQVSKGVGGLLKSERQHVDTSSYPANHREHARKERLVKGSPQASHPNAALADIPAAIAFLDPDPEQYS